MLSDNSTPIPKSAYKCVLLGEGAVGKSSIMLRYVEDKFNGQEKFHSLGPIYYRESNGALLVYDLTDAKSFKRVQKWVMELTRMLGSTCCLFILGNKLDLKKERQVGTEEARAYADSVGAQFAEVSAKENIGLPDVFIQLTKNMMERSVELQLARLERQPSLRRQGSRRRIRVEDSPPPSTTSSRKCC